MKFWRKLIVTNLMLNAYRVRKMQGVLENRPTPKSTGLKTTVVFGRQNKRCGLFPILINNLLS